MLPIHVVRELAALLPIWGVKRVPDRVRDEDGASFLQGPRVSRKLETTRGRDAATERVLALLRRGALRELHTYVLRVDAAPPPGLGAVATAARGKPARGERSDHLRLLHVFRALSPCFDGQHSLLEMMWRQDLSQAEVDAALRAFSDLVVTVQR